MLTVSLTENETVLLGNFKRHRFVFRFACVVPCVRGLGPGLYRKRCAREIKASLMRDRLHSRRRPHTINFSEIDECEAEI